MKDSLREIIRHQLLSESAGPDVRWPPEADAYVDQKLDQMSNSELLQRISEALEKGEV